MKKIIQNILHGISWGLVIQTLVLLVGVIINKDFLASFSQTNFVKSVICSTIVGIGFTMPTLIYNNDRISRSLQIFIHMGIGFVIYFPVAFFAGWIPVEHGFGAIVSFVAIAIATATIIWLCFYLYYKNEAKKMNDEIKKKQGL